MHIVVCVKQIPDPEIAASQFRIDEQAKRVAPLPGTAMVMSPFDEQALEAALRLRDAGAATRITVMTLGPEGARAMLRHGLAMGADDAVLITDAGLDSGNGYTTARVLAAAIGELGARDLILTGRQAADWDAGVVGSGIAELLEWPVVTFARDIKVKDGLLRVERVVENGYDVIEASMPAVVTVSNELGKPRAPSLRETMRASRKPVTVRTTGDLGIGSGELAEGRRRRALERLTVPADENCCEFIAGDTPQTLASNLVQRMREAKLL
jgi:electron transfer flavoprotein beta subunit